MTANKLTFFHLKSNYFSNGMPKWLKTTMFKAYIRSNWPQNSNGMFFPLGDHVKN